MKKSRSLGDDLIEFEATHETKATFKFMDEMPKRGKALKRMIAWALVNDLYELVVDKIPSDRRYDRMRDSLKIGEGPRDVFAVFIDNKARNVKKVDSPVTLIYVKPRRIQDRIKPEIQLLADNSPWTVDTLPFWPDRRQALVVQRRVDKRIVDKIGKLREDSKSKIERQLFALGERSVASAMSKRRTQMRKAKAVPDIAFEMLTLEFGGGSKRGTAMWRSSLKELFPGRVKTVLKKYKQIKETISKPRSGVWKKWPRVDVKVKRTQLHSFVRFQKQLGY